MRLEVDEVATFVDASLRESTDDDREETDDLDDETSEMETTRVSPPVADSAEVIELYPHPGETAPAPDLLDELRSDNERLRSELGRAEEQISELRGKLVSVEYGAKIAERHIAFLERERSDRATEHARIEGALRDTEVALEAARGRETELSREVESARNDNLAAVELLELEHRQALSNERRHYEGELATSQRHAAQRLADLESRRAADIAVMEAEHARALAALHGEYEDQLARANLRAAQSLATQYLILVTLLNR